MSIPDSYRSTTTTPKVTLDLPIPRRALAIGAHPDDVEFGCGATLAKWAAAGCEIFHLILTDGSKGTWDPNVDTQELIATRQREQRRAARCLGGTSDDHVVFAGWIDGELESGLAQRAEVCRWIRRFAPDIVLGHDPWRRYRIHPDHRHAGLLACEGIVAARDPKFFPDQNVKPHRPSALLLWEADEVQHVESCDERAIDAKVAALLSHQSQYETTMHITTHAHSDALADADNADSGASPERTAFRDTIVNEAQNAGSPAGVNTGEAFALLASL